MIKLPNKNRKNKWIISILLMFSEISPLILVSCFPNNKNKVHIINVIDGDTFEDNSGLRYRLLGVDTPESFDSSNNFKSTKGIQKLFASRAAKLSFNTIFNKYVTIAKWKLDPYKRIVAKINYGSISLAKLLLSKGLARVKYISPIKKDFFYYPNTQYYYQLVEIEKYAKINKIGIWAMSPKVQKEIFPK